MDDDRRDVSWRRCVQNLGVWVYNEDLKRDQDVDESVVGKKDHKARVSDWFIPLLEGALLLTLQSAPSAFLKKDNLNLPIVSGVHQPY